MCEALFLNMYLFKTKNSLNVTKRHPTYKVLYLGNVQTVMAKGEHCSDKPLSILWANYEKKGPGAKMKLAVCTSGMDAFTKEQGTTHYWAARITYCITHPKYPHLFCWIYRHEGKKMKVELRCHAVLCKKDAIAKALTVQLHDVTTKALKEFKREKLQRQNHRLLLKSKSGIVATMPKRKIILSAAKCFRPPLEKSRSAPKLKRIDETPQEEEIDSDEEKLIRMSLPLFTRSLPLFTLNNTLQEDEEEEEEKEQEEEEKEEEQEEEKEEGDEHSEEAEDVLGSINDFDSKSKNKIIQTLQIDRGIEDDLQLKRMQEKEAEARSDPKPVPPPRKKRQRTQRLNLGDTTMEQLYLRNDDETLSLSESLGSDDFDFITMECGNDVQLFKEDDSVKYLLLEDSSSEPNIKRVDEDNISDESGFSEGDLRSENGGTIIRLCDSPDLSAIRLNEVNLGSMDVDNGSHLKTSTVGIELLNDEFGSEIDQHKRSDELAGPPYTCVISF